ncbi:MAG: hypothetical protein QM736_16825 [Vicinamibacterales bacterium]
MAALPDAWHGQPGTRAPHVWITQEGQRRSTLDLFQRGWVLVTTDARWADAAADLPVAVSVIAGDDGCAVGRAFGIGDEGASLVRPDGYIAWRVADFPADSRDALRRAFAAAAFTPGAR